MIATPAPSNDFFPRLLEIVCSGGGTAAMLESYIDESERETKVFGISGYAFYPGAAKRFQAEWKPLWGGRCFHMTDFVALQGEFKDMNRTEQSRLIKDAVGIINKHIRFGVSVSCYVDEVRQFAPRWITGMGHAYSVCAHLALMQLGSLARRDEKISYIFEDGHPDSGEADEFIKVARHSPGLRRAYHYRNHSFVSKRDAVPLQAADMLAWEWTKFKDETLDRKVRPIRQSLKVLFLAHPKQYKVAHITGAPLRKYFEHWRRLGLEELADAKK